MIRPPLGCAAAAWVFAVSLAVGHIASGGTREVAPTARYEFAQPHMGTVFRIVLYAPDAERAGAAAAAAFARIAELEAVASDYRPDSELMRLCDRAGSEPVPVSQDLFRLLTVAQEWSRLSSGAFDVTVGPVSRLWRRARRIGERPEPDELARAHARVGYGKLVLDHGARTARFAEAGMQLDLGGIAKGYAADQVQSVLRRHGITRALVAAGGDVVVSNPPPGRAAWSVSVAAAAGLAEPVDTPLALRDAAVSTSGDAEQFITLEGVRYSHIVDPRTGTPLIGRSVAAVVAPTGTSADALATALSVLGPERGLALVEAVPGAAAWIAQETPQGIRRVRSRRWPQTRS